MPGCLFLPRSRLTRDGHQLNGRKVITFSARQLGPKVSAAGRVRICNNYLAESQGDSVVSAAVYVYDRRQSRWLTSRRKEFN